MLQDFDPEVFETLEGLGEETKAAAVQLRKALMDKLDNEAARRNLRGRASLLDLILCERYLDEIRPAAMQEPAFVSG